MATKTRAEMITLTMRRLGVLGQGASASAADAAIVGDALDSIHDQLRKKGLANYATSAFPMWAQEPFAKVLGEEVAPYFGLERPGWRKSGELDLAEQMQGKRHQRSIEVDDF